MPKSKKPEPIQGDQLEDKLAWQGKLDPPDKKFDLIFIDGGHTYDVAKTDIMNCKKLAHKDTIVVMDDTITDPAFVCHWNTGPSQSWNESVKWGVIREEGHLDFCKGRGASWGYYNM